MPAIRHRYLTLEDTDAFEAFIAANADALADEYPNHGRDDFFRACCDGGLMIGGGAAPAFMVRFSDE